MNCLIWCRLGARSQQRFGNELNVFVDPGRVFDLVRENGIRENFDNYLRHYDMYNFSARPKGLRFGEFVQVKHFSKKIIKQNSEF